MTYRDPKDLLEEADKRGLRRALFVTALGLEMDAVRAHLKDVVSVAGRDGAIHECGVFSDLGQEWFVVVVETGAGNHAAQGAVTNAYSLLGKFEIQILVGVGGSRKKDDAPIGSVVASDHVYMPYPGKYGDKGRSGRPRMFQIDGRLVGLARKVKRDKIWPSRIKPPHNGVLPSLENYPVEFPPMALVAPIVSVEAVSADPTSELEQLIARECGDACVVEMEGYGAVYAATSEQTPSILVRGVSDMAEKKDPETDKVRQPIAACHAAAFGFELLSHWGQLYNRISAPVVMAASPSIQPPTLGLQTLVEGVQESVSVSPVTPTAVAEKLIVNIDANFEDIAPDRLAALEAKLSKVAGTSLKIVRIEKGSVRLVVDDPSGALSKVKLEALEAALVDEAPLLGVVPEREYVTLQSWQTELGRVSEHLLSWPTTLPKKEWIPRPELTKLLSTIDTTISSTTALLGAPGSGKSSLLATLGKELRDNRGWPVLAIKADLLDADITSEADLQARLDLPERPSEMLRRLAKLRPVVLLIDQLDALAGYLDIRTGRLNALLNLVRRAARTDNVHIVLSSRPFEFSHDARLRTVAAESLTLELPAWSDITAILEGHGVQAGGWPNDAQEVMRSPQALNMYLQLKARTGSEPFTTYQAMLDRVWEERVLAGEGSARRARLAYDIADHMAEEESLWLARARFDDRNDAVNDLIATGILTPYGSEGSLGFTHQTLFEYALARNFAQAKGRLSQYVLERQASLFVRPKLWASLNYLRQAEVGAYELELETIWTAQGLRVHLRQLLIDFLGQQAMPLDREALLMEHALRLPRERIHAFKAMAGSPGWFGRFARSFVADAMSEDGPTRDALIGVLIPAWSFDAERVTELLTERWITETSNDRSSWFVIQNAPTWSDEVLAIARTIVGRTEFAPSQIDYTASIIGVLQPSVALQLIRAFLDHEFAAAYDEARKLAAIPKPEFASLDAEMVWRMKSNPQGPIEDVLRDSRSWETSITLAEQVPEDFLAIMWPWYLNVFDALRAMETSPPRIGYPIPYEADFRFEGETNLDLPAPPLLSALVAGVRKLASISAESFLAWMSDQSNVELLPVQRLLAHVLASQPETFAKTALSFLLGDTRRFFLGSVEDAQSTTKTLISAVSPYWTGDEVKRFEEAISALSLPVPPDITDAKGRRDWARRIRHIKLDLLRALPTDEVSEPTRRHIVEESRVFPDARLGVRFGGVRTVGSIMEGTDIARASDEEVINAFKRIPDATDWQHPTNWELGGNIQLARAFATFSKEDPVRACRLISRFEPTFGERAAGYALDAMAESADPSMVIAQLSDLVRRGFDGEEFKGSAARAIERLVDRKVNIDNDVVSILESWLKESHQEVSEEPSAKEDVEGIDTAVEADGAPKNDDNVSYESLLWGQGGISILPGGDYPVLEALVRVRLIRQESDQLINSLRGYLHRVRDVKIWDNLLRYLAYLQPGVPDQRGGFLAQIFECIPQLVGSKAAAQLLANVHWWAPDVVNAQLDRWRALSDPNGRRAYGELVALIAGVQPQLAWPQLRLKEIEADFTLVEARTGATLSAVNLWTDTKHRPFSTDLIIRLLQFEERGVWEAAFDLFRLVDELTPDPNTVALLRAIAADITSAPTSLSATYVVERLESLMPHEAVLVGELTQGLVRLWSSDLGNIQTGTAMAAPQLIDLAVTLHRLGPATREIGTSLFEQLIEIDAYSAQQTRDEIDNRFRGVATTRRPRLARRKTRQARSRRSDKKSGHQNPN